MLVSNHKTFKYVDIEDAFGKKIKHRHLVRVVPWYLPFPVSYPVLFFNI